LLIDYISGCGAAVWRFIYLLITSDKETAMRGLLIGVLIIAVVAVVFVLTKDMHGIVLIH
jgi:hypothetical protein